jgi:hypothetical protein
MQLQANLKMVGQPLKRICKHFFQKLPIANSCNDVTLEWKQQSAFVHPVVGEGWSTIPGFVQNRQRE